MSIEWERSPELLSQGIDRYLNLLQDEIGRAAFDEGKVAETSMKRNRPWRDITGNARRGLRVEVERKSNGIILYFIHSVEYGVNLELGRGGRYAILRPEIDRTIPRLKARLRLASDRIDSSAVKVR